MLCLLSDPNIYMHDSLCVTRPVCASSNRDACMVESGDDLSPFALPLKKVSEEGGRYRRIRCSRNDRYSLPNLFGRSLPACSTSLYIIYYIYLRWRCAPGQMAPTTYVRIYMEWNSRARCSKLACA